MTLSKEGNDILNAYLPLFHENEYFLIEDIIKSDERIISLIISNGSNEKMFGIEIFISSHANEITKQLVQHGFAKRAGGDGNYNSIILTDKGIELKEAGSEDEYGTRRLLKVLKVKRDYEYSKYSLYISLLSIVVALFALLKGCGD